MRSSEKFYTVTKQYSIVTGYCADYDHAGRFGADDGYADDHHAVAGGESDRVVVGVQYL